MRVNPAIIPDKNTHGTEVYACPAYFTDGMVNINFYLKGYWICKHYLPSFLYLMILYGISITVGFQGSTTGHFNLQGISGILKYETTRSMTSGFLGSLIWQYCTGSIPFHLGLSGTISKPVPGRYES